MIPGNQPLLIFMASLICPVIANGQVKLTEAALEAGIDHHYLGVNEMGSGAAFFDMDNDGDEDLWLSGGLEQDALYENDGTGHFSEIGTSAGLSFTNRVVTTGVITGDVDNDGYRDVLLLTQVGFPNILLRNNGNKTFLQVSAGSVIKEHEAYNLAAAFGDVDLDGYLDIYVAHYIEKNNLIYNDQRDTVLGFEHDCHDNKLYLNEGVKNGSTFRWQFSESAEAWSVADRGCALATAFTDFDADADPDLLVANDFGAWISPNALFENRFTEQGFDDISISSGMNVGIYGMGIAIGDYDQDLDLDYYITNIGENVLLRNESNGTFSNATNIAGVADTYASEDLFTTGWGTGFMDVDNDQDLDLYVVNGYVPAAPFIANAKANPNRLFINDGNGHFSLLDSIADSPLWGRGLAYADIDLDGDLDFLVTNVNRQATSDTIQRIQLYRNDLENDFNWLMVRLKGVECNKDAFGSRIYLYAGEKTFLQEAHGGFGTHASQHSSKVHFGLGTIENIDSLVVIWPGGKRQVETNIAVNQHLTIEEKPILTNLNREIHQTATLTSFPNPFTEEISLQFHLPKSSDVEIIVFDRLGREVYRKREQKLPPGKHIRRWQTPGPGAFFVRIQTDHSYLYDTIISI